MGVISLFSIAVFISCLLDASKAHRSLERRFYSSPLEPGDVIKIIGRAYGRSVALIRFHSDLGSCDSRPKEERNARRAITCNPLVMKMRSRQRRLLFYKKGEEGNNRDVFVKNKYYSGIYPGAAYTIKVTVTYTGYDVTYNNEAPVTFAAHGDMSHVTMIRANSGDFDDIQIIRKANIPLNEPGCGIRKIFIFRNKWARITNGQDADAGAYPWQVALRRKVVYSWAPYPHVCGGSLISSCWVLTAAHCVITTAARHKAHFEIKVGDLFNGNDTWFLQDEDQQTLAIESVHVHPDFSTEPVPKNDVALIELRKDAFGKCAVYSDYVQSVCLPEPGVDHFPIKTECEISGWGAKNWTDRPRDYPHHLQYGKIRLQDYEECKALYGRDEKYNKTQVTDGMMCAGSEGIDTCQGDSGGPLVCRRSGAKFAEDNPFVLWGVTSWGHGCADTHKPGVYAKVIDFIGWIRDVRAGLV